MSDDAKMAYYMLAMVGDRAATAALAFRCVALKKTSAFFQTTRNTGLSGTVMTAALVNEGLVNCIDKASGVNLGVGKAGATAFEVILGTIAVSMDLRSVDKAMAPVYAAGMESLRVSAEDLAGLAPLEEQEIRNDSVTADDVCATVLRIRHAVESMTSHKFPKNAPELEMLARFGGRASAKVRDQLGVLRSLGSATLSLVYAIQCMERGQSVDYYQQSYPDLLGVVALAKHLDRPAVSALFAEATASHFQVTGVRCGAVYALVGVVARRMSISAVKRLCVGLGILP